MGQLVPKEVLDLVYKISEKTDKRYVLYGVNDVSKERYGAFYGKVSLVVRDERSGCFCGLVDEGTESERVVCYFQKVTGFEMFVPSTQSVVFVPLSKGYYVAVFVPER